MAFGKQKHKKIQSRDSRMSQNCVMYKIYVFIFTYIICELFTEAIVAAKFIEITKLY